MTSSAFDLPGESGAARPAAPLGAVLSALRRDRGSVVFAAAVLVVALHTVVDLDVAREPGVPLVDHLVPLAASLGLLALAAARASF